MFLLFLLPVSPYLNYASSTQNANLLFTKLVQSFKRLLNSPTDNPRANSGATRTARVLATGTWRLINHGVNKRMHYFHVTPGRINVGR